MDFLKVEETKKQGRNVRVKESKDDVLRYSRIFFFFLVTRENDPPSPLHNTLKQWQWRRVKKNEQNGKLFVFGKVGRRKNVTMNSKVGQKKYFHLKQRVGRWNVTSSKNVTVHVGVLVLKNNVSIFRLCSQKPIGEGRDGWQNYRFFSQRKIKNLNHHRFFFF